MAGYSLEMYDRRRGWFRSRGLAADMYRNLQNISKIKDQLLGQRYISLLSVSSDLDYKKFAPLLTTKPRYGRITASLTS